MPTGDTHDYLRLFHTSDLHLGYGGESVSAAQSKLGQIVSAAIQAECIILIVAGDMFDNNRVSMDLVRSACDLLGGSRLHVIVLPGNHDCLVEDSVYRKIDLVDGSDLHILTEPDGERVFLNEEPVGVEIWGRPVIQHQASFHPVAGAPRRSPALISIGVAHGQFVNDQDEGHAWSGLASPILASEVAALDYDYLALGHWDHSANVSCGTTVAWYSGAPSQHFGCPSGLVVSVALGRTTIVQSCPLPAG